MKLRKVAYFQVAKAINDESYSSFFNSFEIKGKSVLTLIRKLASTYSLLLSLKEFKKIYQVGVI